MEKEDLLYCYNKGCGLKFDPSDNNDESCLYHPGAPYFHDAYKIWNCCNKKSTDFGTWLSLKGCTRGKHSSVKPAQEVKHQKSEEMDESYVQKEVIVWNGLNKPAARQNYSAVMRPLKLEPTMAALRAIEKFQSEKVQESEPSIRIGALCRNPGCEKAYEGEKSHDETCVYHNGIAVFHEGMKYWSCCEKKTTDFSTFLEQRGCVVGKHCWIKAERVEKIREDWFSGGGYIHLNIYCRGAIPELCVVECNGIILQMKIMHGFGVKETHLNYELFGRIDVDGSKVIVGERKLELVLKQDDTVSWPRLTYSENSESQTD
ncbi:unnamed protein product [Thelazia callipaeda]|uniref:CHORD domain-containing protein n=1 Tax=Thelazia callipaeda TaxID=103827 RepID=A0A0N5DAZ7_THECL|nr:unnamed protein product [Thelazia callipaeda]